MDNVGAKAALFQLACGSEFITRLAAEWLPGSLQGEFRAPLSQWPDYWPQFETILGTWVWN